MAIDKDVLKQHNIYLPPEKGPGGPIGPGSPLSPLSPFGPCTGSPDPSCSNNLALLISANNSPVSSVTIKFPPLSPGFSGIQVQWDRLDLKVIKEIL